MSDERPDPEQPEPQPPSTSAPAGYTPGGYAYEVVGAPAAAAGAASSQPVEAATQPAAPARGRRAPLLLVGAIIASAIIAAGTTWFIFGRDSGGDGHPARVSGNVSNVINAFSQGQASGTLRRFEGSLPPGFPDLPRYPDSQVVSSLVQLNGDDALFLAVFDTTDHREDVTAFFRDELDSDNLQIDGGGDSRDSALFQFSRTDNADVSGIVLVAESEDGDITTIFYSVEVISGADDVDLDPFAPRVSRELPAGFPDDVPLYPDAVIIETVFQREARAEVYGLATITRDTAESVLDFYRGELEAQGWTVSEADASQSLLEDAEGINFEDEAGEITGSVIVGVFADDRNYSRIELQVRTARATDDQ